MKEEQPTRTESDVLITNLMTASREAGFCRGAKLDDSDANLAENNAIDDLRVFVAASESRERTAREALRKPAFAKSGFGDDWYWYCYCETCEAARKVFEGER